MNRTFENIIVKSENKIGYLIFNRPTQLNAMNREMMDEIIEAIQLINADDTINVGVISGSERAFMAGADIKEYGSQTPEQFDAFQKKGIQLYDAIENADIPWIAAVNGFALGGGFEIAMACDLIVAKESAKMGLPEVFLSLVPGGGGTQRLAQKIGINRAKEVLFTGKQYSAKTFHDWGIVNLLVEDESFDKAVSDFAKKLSRRPKKAIKELKRLANLSIKHPSFQEHIEEEGKTVAKLFLAKEAKDAIQTFIDKNEK